MRWQTTPDKEPKVGDERIVTKFLWLPLKINDSVRWLEFANVCQRLVEWREADMAGYYTWTEWIDIAWAND